MSNKTEAPDLFTVYYMNHSKVYEMRMLLDNTLWKDGSNEEDKATVGNADVHAKGETKVPLFPKLAVEGDGKFGHEKRTKMIDTFEYINTVSRMLADIKRRIGDGKSNDIILKIPIDGADLFESGYSIDDLLIGKVGIIGICKGKVYPSNLRSSYEYFQTKGKTAEPEDDGFIDGSYKERTDDQVDNPTTEKDETEATYIDVIAVIQAVNKKSE